MKLYKGQGHNFFRKKRNIPATVDRIEYDPNRTAYIALITYDDKQKSYIIGNICMDMMMIDLTGIRCYEGDIVTIFGDQIPPEQGSSHQFGARHSNTALSFDKFVFDDDTMHEIFLVQKHSWLPYDSLPLVATTLYILCVLLY